VEANNLSYWEAKSLIPQADIFILGGGMVGLSTAISLKEKNSKLRVCVLEKFVIPQGASSKNAGFACFGSVSEILDDLRISPESEVIALMKSRWEGLQILRSRLGDTAIGYDPVGGFEVFREKDQSTYFNCIDKIDYLNKIVKDQFNSNNCYSILDENHRNSSLKPVKGFIYNRLEGLIDTGKMLNALIQKAKDLSITLLYGISIDQIIQRDNDEKIYLKSNMDWVIPVSKLVVATNGFTPQLLPNLEIVAVRNQVLVTNPIQGLQLNGGFHLNKGYVYFRNINNRILIGGGRNIDFQGETTHQFGTTPIILDYLKELMKELFHIDRPYQYDYSWSGILGVGASKTPLVKRLNQNLVIGVRLGGMGVALSSKIGVELADLILDS
jgi:glycine/D-amino acid oxidase-like deaminating enzyme